MPQQPFGPGAAVMRLDVAAAVIDEVHVMHARWAGRHTGETGEAPVDVLDGFGADRLAALEHILYQVDAAARAVELVAEQDISRTGCSAEAAMNAGAQDLFRGGGIRIGELRQRELGPHALSFLRACGWGSGCASGRTRP